jgi:hypothetical protein
LPFRALARMLAAWVTDEVLAMTGEDGDNQTPEPDPGDPGKVGTKGQQNAAEPAPGRDDSGDPGHIGTRDLQEGRREEEGTPA